MNQMEFSCVGVTPGPQRRRNKTPLSPFGISEKTRERFLTYLQRDEATGCLNWTGGLSKSGYGKFGINGKSERAHRAAWVLAGREITADKPHILHTCDNRRCCEVSHLWAGTHAENMADKANKGLRRRMGNKLYGVLRRPNGKYRGRLYFRGKWLVTATVTTPEEAAAAVRDLAISLGLRGHAPADARRRVAQSPPEGRRCFRCRRRRPFREYAGSGRLCLCCRGVAPPPTGAEPQRRP